MASGARFQTDELGRQRRAAQRVLHLAGIYRLAIMRQRDGEIVKFFLRLELAQHNKFCTQIGGQQLDCIHIRLAREIQ